LMNLKKIGGSLHSEFLWVKTNTSVEWTLLAKWMLPFGIIDQRCVAGQVDVAGSGPFADRNHRKTSSILSPTRSTKGR